MYIKEVTYEDFNGDQITEKLHFNLTKAEIAKINLSTPEGMDKKLMKMVEANDGKDLVEFLDEMILLAYGVRSEDGKRFRKSKEITEDFKNSNAYSEFFMQVITDSSVMTDFINKIMPSDLIEAAKNDGLLDSMGQPTQAAIDRLN